MEADRYLIEDYSSVSASGTLRPSTGTQFLSTAGTLVLLNKYKRLSYPFDFGSLSNRQSFIWTGSVLNTHNYEESLQKCLEDDASDITFILLRLGRGILTHVNTLYFFKNIKTIFRFESNGINAGNYNPIELDNSLEALFSSLEGWTYVKHDDLGFYGMGCQLLENESDREDDDPGGFCVSWNFWMIEYIMNHPSMIKTVKNLSDIYSISCADINPQFDPKRQPVKSLIREYNLEIFRECLSFTFGFMPLFSHAKKRIVSRIDKDYSIFSTGSDFHQGDNSLHHGMLDTILHDSYDTLYKIDENTFTIHGCNIELCRKIMSEFNQGFERRTKSRALLKKARKKNPTKNKKKKKKKSKKPKRRSK